MNDRTRIAAYLAGLVAVFGLAWTLGNATGGDPTPRPPAEHTSQHHGH